MGLKIQTLKVGASIQKPQTSFIPVRTLFRAQNQNMKLDEGFHTRSMMLAFQEEIQAAAISQLEQLKFSNSVAAALVDSQPQFTNFCQWETLTLIQLLWTPIIWLLLSLTGPFSGRQTDWLKGQNDTQTNTNDSPSSGWLFHLIPPATNTDTSILRSRTLRRQREHAKFHHNIAQLIKHKQ